ncbi:MAG TPA: TolC family protein, partial [Phnomibacter sp.]|nr:TolC family protein [Phnomibacter sp.]
MKIGVVKYWEVWKRQVWHWFVDNQPLMLLAFIPAYLFLFAAKGNAQSSALPDSLLKLSPEEYLNLVRLHHPVAKQARLAVDASEAMLLASRGLFDPALYFTNDRKTFDGKNYFNYQNAELKIPTWYGVEIMAGLENNGGDNLTTEATRGQSSYAGFKVPLAKNLLMDQRRAALATAKLLVNQTEAERLLALNDLLFDAAAAYGQWVQAYQLYQVFTNAVNINEQRYKAIRITVEQGDRAGVDSTEALTQLLIFRAAQAEAWNNFVMTGYELDNFLWTPEGQPYDLPSAVIPALSLDDINPANFAFLPLPDLLAAANQAHPKLRSLGYKLDALEVERQLKFQSLLPTLNLKYNALASGYEFWKGWNVTSMQNNYKFGVELGMPLLLREGRGNYRAAKIKISATNLEIDN